MKKYYLHNGIASSGPFSLEDLKMKQITTTTPVWFEGMEKWKYANDIAELHSLLNEVAPPLSQAQEIQSEVAPPNSKESKKTIFGLSKNAFLTASLILVLVLFTLIFDVFQKQRSEELDAKNRKTEKENQQYLLQQKVIEEQKIELKQLEQAEAERSSNEKKLNINSRLNSIANELTIIKENLVLAKEKLKDTNEFKLLRSQAQKTKEMETINEEIYSLEKKLDVLDQESYRLNLELEKIK
jgi:hypothetical protein